MAEHSQSREARSAKGTKDALRGKCSDASNAITTLVPDLRRLKIYLAVHESGGIHRAAKKLHLSQSSVTRAVQQIEFQIGRPLFDRTARGMACNALGEILAERTRRAIKQIDLAESEIVGLQHSRQKLAFQQSLSSKITYRQFRALIAIADYQTQTVAARTLALTQPALTLSLRSCETLVGEQLFHRTARGMIATPFGEVLSRRAKLAFSEISAAVSDMSSYVGALSGTIVVGVLPLSGTLLAPRAANRLLRDHPFVKIKIYDGTYQSQIQGLLRGDIDLIVGGLDYRSPAEIIQEPLFDEGLSIIARKGHALFEKKNPRLRDLAGFEWILPPDGTPARVSFDRIMIAAGLDVGRNPIVANSSPVRALLLESDRLAVMSRHQIYFEESAGLLGALPIRLVGTELPIGIRSRANTAASAAANAFIRHLRDLATEMDFQRRPMKARLRVRVKDS